MKTTGPLLVAALMGVLMIFAEFIPRYPFNTLSQTAYDWFSIISAFAIILGLLSLLYVNLQKIQRQSHDWQYAVVTLFGFLLMVIPGFVYGEKEGSPFLWAFNNIQIPLSSTMFSMLAFFVASAAFRAFRARTLEASLLLVAAFIVMIGRVPIGEVIPYVSDVADWIMAVPNTAGQRAVKIGIALGVVSTSLRLILGIERSYIGGE